VQVSGLTTGVSSIAVGLAEACAVTATGGVVCWGEDNITQGLLSDAGPRSTSVPAPIPGLAQGMTAVSIAPSGGHACALTQGGGVVCWGGGADGQLGNGSMNSSATPVPVTGLSSGVTSVSVGQGFACALSRPGGVECWGAVIGAQAARPGATANCRDSLSQTPCSDTPSPVVGL
jgi:alpha-tubulin suppressor-like RCC1 family protein